MNFRSNVHELFKSFNTNGFGTYLPNNSLIIYIATNLILYGRVYDFYLYLHYHTRPNIGYNND